MISVALCTYNGALYIREQIESIVNQTRKVDEIVVCDDCSNDNTVPILQQLSSIYPNVIRLIQNDHQLGVFDNFQKAFSNCSGDIIFMSDQDDIWMPHKVESTMCYLKRHPLIKLVFSDSTMYGGPFDGKRTSDYLNFPKDNRRMFAAGLAYELSLFQVFSLGSTMAFRRDLLRELDNKTLEQFVKTKHLQHGTGWDGHDYFLQLIASSIDAIAYINKPLSYYRIHEKQTSGITNNIQDILKSITIPASGEVWPNPYPSSLTTDIALKARQEYMIERNHLLHNPWAPLIIARQAKKYRQLYGPKAFRIMRYDIARSVQRSLSKIFHLA